MTTLSPRYKDLNGAPAGTLISGMELSTLLTTISSSVSELVINQNVIVSSNTAIPATLAVNVINGASITISAGITLTINGPFSSGLYKIFNGAGLVSFSSTSIGVVFPEWWGVSDLAVAINAALIAIGSSGTSGGIVDATNLRGSYALSQTINLQSYCTLKFNDWCTLTPGTASMTMLNMGFGANNLEGGRWDASGTSFTGTVILLEKPISWQKCTISKLYIKNDGNPAAAGRSDTAIYFHPTTANYNQISVIVSDVGITGFNVGIYLNSDGLATAINANTFSNIFIDNCRNSIYMEYTSTGQVTGNFFSNVTIEAPAGAIYGVYCNGAQNIFNGISIFDITGATIPVRFGANSSGNYVQAITSAGTNSDLGLQNNFIAVADAYQLRQYRGGINVPSAATTVFTFNSNFQAGTYTFGCYDFQGAASTYTNTAIVTYNGTRTDITYNFGNVNMPISVVGNSIILTPGVSIFMYWTLK